MKPLRYFVALTLVAGVCLTGRAVYLHAKATLAGVLIRRAWQVTARSGEPHPSQALCQSFPEAGPISAVAGSQGSGGGGT